jgi:type II secretion system protein N
VSGLRVLAAAGTFAASVALLFPTDLVARHLLTRASRPGWPAVAFAHARLGVRGIRLEDVTLRDVAGVELVRAERADLRPSLAGLFRDGRGLPWRIEAELCGGTSDASIAADGPATAITVAWRDADLGACPPLALTGAGVLAGRAHGTARFSLVSGTPAEGTGRVEVETATWHGAGPMGALGALHAATASLRWRLHEGRLFFEALDVAGPEVTVEGRGELRLAEPWDESDLDLRLALAPASNAPQLLRLLLGVPADGTRNVVLGGTLAHPRALLQ